MQQQVEIISSPEDCRAGRYTCGKDSIGKRDTAIGIGPHRVWCEDWHPLASVDSVLDQPVLRAMVDVNDGDSSRCGQPFPEGSKTATSTLNQSPETGRPE